MRDYGRTADGNRDHRWLLRQFLHFLAGVPALLLIWLPAWQVAAAVAAVAFIAALAYPLSRHSGVYRPGETRVSGAFWYAAGVIAALLIFPKDAAFVGWLMLAAGDSAATVTGTLWPMKRFGHRSVGGSIGFIICALAVSYGVLYPFGQSPNVPALVAASITGAIAEALSNRINDNLIIPLAASLAYSCL